MFNYGIGLLVGGAAMAARPFCSMSRAVGGVMVGAGLFLMATPAFAQDQSLVAADNSEVSCRVSLKGLTRVSLKDDRFASISKMSTGIASEDFTVVNEPTRGDIYISVPEGYSRPEVSFFGTTSKGYVYKFACKAFGDGAHQVFVTNKQIVAEQPTEMARKATPADTSIALVQAMYAQTSLDGFELRQPLLEPVRVGDLRVQMITEYRGPDLTGRSLRIENKGGKDAVLDESVIAPSNAVAVSVSKPMLKPGETTTAFIVTKTGAVQ